MTATPVLDEAERRRELAATDAELRRLREQREAARRLEDRDAERALAGQLDTLLERRLDLQREQGSMGP